MSLGGVRIIFGVLKLLIAFHTTGCMWLLQWKRLFNTPEKFILFYFLCGEGRHSLEECENKQIS